ncbi:MAG TPA: hypothetical protein VF530_23955 [Planctomycetota bacterium]
MSDARSRSVPVPASRLAALLIALLAPLLLALLLSLLLSLLAAAAGAQALPRLEDRELEPLARALATHTTAREADEGLSEAVEGLKAALAALEGPGEGRAGTFLRRHTDLGRAWWLARGLARDVKKGKVTSETLKRGSFAGTGLEYAYRVPKDYDAKRGTYTLILALPDVEEAPALHLRTHWLAGEVLEQAILLAPAMPARPEDWEAVAVKGKPGGLTHALTMLAFALETFAVEPGRVYVAGRGRSVPAALAVGNYAPQRFAGVIARAGDAGEIPADNFTNLPTWFAPGGERATQFQHALRAVGAETCTLAEQDDEQALWAWIQKHPRTSQPESITLVPGNPFPTRAYWLRIAPSAPNARAQASVDRAANTLRISTAGAAQVTLYLNDEVVDLEQPVRVLLNGQESSGPVARNLATALELLADGTSDAGSVYVARLVLDVKEGAEAEVGPTARDAELDERLAAAGTSVDELWRVHEWCLASGRPADARVLARIVRLAPDHAGARAALGHAGEPGRWFDSPGAWERFRAGQEEAAAKARGLVLDGKLWIHRDERALAVKGWVKDPPTGQWLTPGDLRKLAEGWVRQDLEWIAPQDAARVDEGLWRSGDEWVDLAAANRRHATIESIWRIPRGEVLLHATTDREVALRAAEHMGRALVDLRKVFGGEPALPLSVCLLRDEEQYDRFAFGEPDGSRRATDAQRTYLVHHAYFAESWFQKVGGKLAFRGMGVTYWDPLVPNGDLYGVHAARLALGLAYVDALDPSPKALRKALASGPGEDHAAAYHAEKLLPAWLRWGGAVYAERFFRDDAVGEGGDPWWARTWSRQNLEGRGGLRPLAEVLAFRLDPDDRDDGQKLLLEAGHVVSFLVDGGCAPVTTAHEDFKRALAAGGLQKSHVEKLTQALVANEAALRAF